MILPGNKLLRIVILDLFRSFSNSVGGLDLDQIFWAPESAKHLILGQCLHGKINEYKDPHNDYFIYSKNGTKPHMYHAMDKTTLYFIRVALFFTRTCEIHNFIISSLLMRKLRNREVTQLSIWSKFKPRQLTLNSMLLIKS